jgi:hypothetical protein
MGGDAFCGRLRALAPRARTGKGTPHIPYKSNMVAGAEKGRGNTGGGSISALESG